MRTPTGLATTVVAAIAVAGLGAGPALADSQSHQDPRGDVENFDISAKPKPGIDLVKAKNTYEGQKLSLAMTGVKLPKKGYLAVWEIRTDEFNYELVYDHTKKKAVVTYGTAPGRLLPSSAARGDSCAGVKVDRQGQVLTAVVPRPCFNGADSVRVASLAIQVISETRFKVDDARQKGYDFAGAPKFGPPLERN